MTPDYLTGARLFQDVAAYTDFGEHRTASEGEEKTTHWIADELRQAGLRVSYQDFTLRQFHLRECSLTVGEQAVECFPWWFPCGTGPQPIRATLAPFNAGDGAVRGKIALVKQQARWMSPRMRADIEKMVADKAKAGALAVVFVSDGPAGELVAVNTAEDTAPWPIPVVLTGRKDEAVLEAAAHIGTEVSLLVDGSIDLQAKARNLFGRYGASESDIIVVSTPKSGWFRCGGERGPGVAIVLALARWIQARQPQVSYWLDFNSGHELHNLGTRRFVPAHRSAFRHAGVAEAAPAPDRVRAWVHLGANIATWRFDDTPSGLQQHFDPSKYPVVASHEDLLPLVTQSFAHMPGVKPQAGAGIGEFGPVVAAGYRGFGVYGGPYHYFHCPSDSPQGTAPELLEPVALAIIQALEAIEGLYTK